MIACKHLALGPAVNIQIMGVGIPKVAEFLLVLVPRLGAWRLFVAAKPSVELIQLALEVRFPARFVVRHSTILQVAGRVSVRDLLARPAFGVPALGRGGSRSARSTVRARPESAR